jgi:hypothetical protein
MEELNSEKYFSVYEIFCVRNERDIRYEMTNKWPSKMDAVVYQVLLHTTDYHQRAHISGFPMIPHKVRWH